MQAEWTVVIPVKGTGGSKSRLGASAELATAIALDTVDAALAVARVIVVTSASAASTFARLGAAVVLDGGGGLNAAIASGIAAAGDAAVAVLLGDVPALTREELASALALASEHERAMVADRDGTGTVLITALVGWRHAPAFGLGSRAAHRAAGYVELPVPGDSGLRCDVDTEEQLLALAPRLGPRSSKALAAAR